MAEEMTYLELSEGASHKFYEVTLRGTELTIRYGRIGDRGQSSTSRFPSEEKAKAEAQKKVGEKLRKGYERAVIGGRKKRAVTRRSAALAEAAARKPKGGRARLAPVLWKFDTGASALGIFVDAERIWVGNEAGHVFLLDHERRALAKYKLPDGVKCVVADEGFLYAGCDDGNVYDLSGKMPRVAYEVADEVDIYWLDIFGGVLAVSDALGNVTVINHEDESQWSKKSAGDKGWMVRADEIGVYHGHSKGVTMYDWESGKELWTRPTQGWIGFGWQETSLVFASTADGYVHRFSKKGDAQTVYRCDAYLCSCATAEDGKYVFAGDAYGAIYCFAEGGERLWKLDSGCGAAQSMQYHDGKLYVVTHHGFLACLDASEAAIEAATRGHVPAPETVVASKLEEASVGELETTRDASSGVVVECVKEAGKLRVRVVSPGFDPSYRVQFPRSAREEGARYVVDEVRASSRGGFYRAFGNIKKLVVR